ncbi:MAG: alpha/beta hydrolase [Thaumarchaeota archaeon]|nr:alpha/beta hydrolase [Nitrososphaerota archaeon]
MQAVEKQVELGEFRVNYASAGNGAPVLMLHGSDHRESWKVWDPMLGLADTYGLVIPDLVGYGRSSAPLETPDHRAQAQVIGDLLDKLGIKTADVVGAGWGGQVGLELALHRPEAVRSVVLIAAAYDKEQLRPLQKMRKPTLIVYAEDDMVTQLKAGYLLRDAIGTSRLEVLDAVAKDPSHDFTMSHKLQKFRPGQVLQLIRLFLSKPQEMVSEPPELENELKGMALRKEDEPKETDSSGTP